MRRPVPKPIIVQEKKAVSATVAATFVEPSDGRGASGWLPLVMLFLIIFIFSYIDHQLITIVVQPMKASLGISDFQIGLLQGFAFTIVLAVAAIVASPLVDRSNRTRLLGIAMIVWCLLTVRRSGRSRIRPCRFSAHSSRGVGYSSSSARRAY
ncbi:MFS transporter [Sphingobium chlorophenolicum]|uniref:MFS transporter n=1 Tax=Sphingobium chlorophenolicum TaxID=46429 RepID=UPI00117EA331|nr:MFS transporter [Sphingobium chlorophenolicum]